MIARKIFLGLTTLLFLMGCTKKLTDSERAWNPYSLNEVLVFESSEKELDTLVIRNINEVSSTGPTPELYRYKVLIVYAEKLNSKNKLFSKKRILDIYTSTPKPKRPSGLTFELYFSNAIFGGTYTLKKLENSAVISTTTKGGAFDDVIKIEPEIYYSKKQTDVKYMYWSKKHGYIKFERADGFTWELVDKYIPK